MANINKIILPDGNEYNIEVQTQNINGVIPLSKGGTNATDPGSARANLGLGTAAIKNVTTSSSFTSNNNLPTANAVKNFVEEKGYITIESLPDIQDDVIYVYPRSGVTELTKNWLSKTRNGEPLIPQTGVIYILIQQTEESPPHYTINTQFRWDGNVYIEISNTQILSNQDIDSICNT